MNIQHEQQDSQGAFFIEQNSRTLAQLHYLLDGQGDMVIDHTEVSDELEGKGIGKQLVAAAVEFVRKQGIKIVAECPFANSVIQKTPEFQDVLADLD